MASPLWIEGSNGTVKLEHGAYESIQAKCKCTCKTVDMITDKAKHVSETCEHQEGFRLVRKALFDIVAGKSQGTNM